MAQLGRAPHWGCGGRWFKSSYPDVKTWKRCDCGTLYRTAGGYRDCFLCWVKKHPTPRRFYDSMDELFADLDRKSGKRR